MVNTCVAVNCKNGYQNKTEEGTSFHGFPQNQQLRANWVKNVCRKDFKPTANSKVCSKHFTADSFKTASTDSNTRRKRKRASGEDLKRM